MRSRTRDTELIVVDDGSDLPIEPLVRAKVPNARIVGEVSAGPSAARNEGSTLARGRFISVLDADDFWSATPLRRLLKGFQDAPGAAVVQGYVRPFVRSDDATSIAGASVGPPQQGFSLGASLTRREILLNETFNENLRRSEDADLFIRWAERRMRRLLIPDVVLYYRNYGARARSTSFPKAVAASGELTATHGCWIESLQRSLMRRRAQPAISSGRNVSPIEREAAARAISVIITVRNGMPYLPQAVAAIRRQTLPPHETVAVVGPSEDGTLEYLRSEPGIRVIAQSSIGLATARNAGLGAASCPLIAFCDSDDLWHPAKLERQVEVISQLRAPAACIVKFREFSENGSELPHDKRFWNVQRLGWTPSALLVHRDLFDLIGTFDSALGLGCDIDWFRRLRQSDIPCALAGGVLLDKRRHSFNLSSDPQSNRAAIFKVLRKMRGEIKRV
jgi:glycosyltransferase involved in cell wall biosynthesis